MGSKMGVLDENFTVWKKGTKIGVFFIFKNGVFFHFLRLVPPEFFDFELFEKRRKKWVPFYRG